MMAVNVPVCLARAWAHAATTSTLPQIFLLPSVQEMWLEFAVAAWIHATIVIVNMADAAGGEFVNHAAQEAATPIMSVAGTCAASGMANGDGGWMEKDHVNLASQEDAQAISIVNRDNSANVESASIRGPSACRISIAEERKSARWEGVYRATLEGAQAISNVNRDKSAKVECVLIRARNAIRISIAEEMKSARWESVYQATLEGAQRIGNVNQERNVAIKRD